MNYEELTIEISPGTTKESFAERRKILEAAKWEYDGLDVDLDSRFPVSSAFTVVFKRLIARRD